MYSVQNLEIFLPNEIFEEQKIRPENHFYYFAEETVISYHFVLFFVIIYSYDIPLSFLFRFFIFYFLKTYCKLRL